MRHDLYIVTVFVFLLLSTLAGCSGESEVSSNSPSSEPSMDSSASTPEEASLSSAVPEPASEIISEPQPVPPQPLPPEPKAVPPEPKAVPPEPQPQSQHPGLGDLTAQPFTVPGKFSINSPGNGYRWRLARKMRMEDVNVSLFVCMKEGSTSVITLAVEEHTADLDAERQAVIKGHYNGLYKSLVSGGFTEVKGTQPSLESPLPDRVSYSFSGRKPDGSAACVNGLTCFGKNVYVVQVAAGTLEQANEFAEVARTLKENDQ